MVDVGSLPANAAWLMLFDFIVGMLGAWLVGRFAQSLGLIDAPSARSSHTRPTPKGGGIGILLAFIFSCIILKIAYIFLAAATGLALLSLLGDRTHLSPLLRLFLQFFAAALVVFILPDISINTGSALCPAWLGSIFMAGLLVIFIAGTANFYNFMDGSNGIAAITAVVGFSLLAGYGARHGAEPRYILLCLGLVAACLGFLPFNIPRARVFMGDVGSILLGFVFAVIVLIFAGTLTEFVVLAAFMFPFYADELITMAERIRQGQSLTSPHRRHLYQVLANEASMPHWQVALIYGGLQLLVGLSVWLLAEFGLLAVLTLLLAWTIMFFWVNYRIKRHYL